MCLCVCWCWGKAPAGFDFAEISLCCLAVSYLQSVHTAFVSSLYKLFTSSSSLYVTPQSERSPSGPVPDYSNSSQRNSCRLSPRLLVDSSVHELQVDWLGRAEQRPRDGCDCGPGRIRPHLEAFHQPRHGEIHLQLSQPSAQTCPRSKTKRHRSERVLGPLLSSSEPALWPEGVGFREDVLIVGDAIVAQVEQRLFGEEMTSHNKLIFSRDTGVSWHHRI